MELKTDNKKTEMTFHGSMDLASYIQDHHLGNSVSHEINHSFCPYTWDETKEAFLNGWTESEKIKINADSIDIMGDQASYGIEYDVTGDYIDMGACISGIPECWGNIIEEPKAMKKAKVLVDFCAGSSVTPEQIENRGSAIIAMVDGLRNAGYYLEITISMLSIDNTYNGKDFQLNLIFETDNGYSRDVMAFCVAHPGMLRRITFAAMEKHFHKSVLGNYGTPKKPDVGGFDIVIPRILWSEKTWDTLESSKSEIEKIIKEYEGRE